MDYRIYTKLPTDMTHFIKLVSKMELDLFDTGCMPERFAISNLRKFDTERDTIEVELKNPASVLEKPPVYSDTILRYTINNDVMSDIFDEPIPYMAIKSKDYTIHWYINYLLGWLYNMRLKLAAIDFNDQDYYDDMITSVLKYKKELLKKEAS